MARIGFFSDQVIYGGGESNLVRLARSTSAFHDVTIVAPRGGLLDAARASGLETIEIRAGRSRWLKGIPLCLNRHRAMTRSFDIAHAYSLHILPMLLGHPKLFWTTHGPWEKPWGLRARIIALYTKQVIAVSRDVAKVCAFETGKLTIVPLGAVTSDECLGVKAGSRSLADLKVVRVGVLGRIQRVKGQDLAIDAMAALAAMNPERRFQLHLGGAVDRTRPEDLAFMRELQGRVSRCSGIPNLEITWHGFVDRPDSFIDSMDLIFVSSRYESFSMVVVESLSRGKLVVAPEIGGPAEILLDCSVGLMFEAGSSKSAQSALQRAIGDFQYSPQRLVDRARVFTIEAQRDSLLKLYGLAERGEAGLLC